MTSAKTLSIINLLALLAHISFSYLTQFGLVNEQTVGEVSDTYNSLLTPAGLTFSIWGVIYTALLFLCAYHLRMAFKHPPSHPANEAVRRIGGWFVLNNVSAIVWLIAWTHFLLAASLLLIFLQLLTLIVMNLRLRIHDPAASVPAKIFTQFPLSLYFGWIVIASIASTSIFLVATGWNGSGLRYSAIEWTRIMIGVIVMLSVVVIFRRKNVIFGLVVVWALYGIILKRSDADPVIYGGLVRTAWMGLAIVGVSCLIQFLLNLVYKVPGAVTKESADRETKVDNQHQTIH